MKEKIKKSTKKNFKRKSYCKKIKDKKTSENENEQKHQFTNKEKNFGQSFLQKLKNAAENLIYISETDSEILPFIGEKSETVSIESLQKQINFAPDVKIEEMDFEDFFENLIKTQDWFEDEENNAAEKFLKLKKLLEENLKDLKVFKIGEIEIKIYVVGLDEDNNLSGIKTEAVET